VNFTRRTSAVRIREANREEAVSCRVYVNADCATGWMQMRMLIRAIRHGRTLAHIGTILNSNVAFRPVYIAVFYIREINISMNVKNVGKRYC